MQSKPGFIKSRSFERIDCSKDPGNLKVQIFERFVRGGANQQPVWELIKGKFCIPV